MTNHETPAAGEQLDVEEQRRRAYADEFGALLSSAGSPTMDGRVLGYLMIMQQPFISSGDLGAVLNASAGSVSTSTRRLLEIGYIKRHVVPGDRSHYFRADRDIWGSWLSGERRYLDRERELIEYGLSIIDLDDDKNADARERLTNGRDYFSWVASYHRKMLVDWEAFKAARDAGEPTES